MAALRMGVRCTHRKSRNHRVACKLLLITSREPDNRPRGAFYEASHVSNLEKVEFKPERPPPPLCLE